MIPAHVPLTLAREVKTERSAGSSVEEIARTLAWWLELLATPAACLACVSRVRRGLPAPCRMCVAAPGGWWRWREPSAVVEEPEPLRAVAAPQPLHARSDRPTDAHQAEMVAEVEPGHDEVDDAWDLGGWWPGIPFAGQLVVDR